MEQLNLFDEPAPQDPETYLDGVKMLLARMDTNPEEFSISSGKWSSMLRDLFAREHGLEGSEFGKMLTPNERNALAGKYREIVRTNFTSRVLKTLSMPTDTLGSSTEQLRAAQEQMKGMLNQKFAEEYTK